MTEPRLEVKRYMDAPNVTLQLLAVEGIVYTSKVDGATTTLNFLEFFSEVSNNFLPNREPVLCYGDHILKGDMLGGGAVEVVYILTRIKSYQVSFQQYENYFKRG